MSISFTAASSLFRSTFLSVTAPVWSRLVFTLLQRIRQMDHNGHLFVAPPAGLEPATVGIEARCAIHLRQGGSTYFSQPRLRPVSTSSIL